MAKVLILAEHDGATLNPSTSKCIACAQSIEGAEIDVLVCADQPDSVAAEASTLSGVGRVLTAASPANANPIAAVLAPQVVAAAEGYDYVFGPSTTFGKDVMPRVAALLGVNQISDIMSVEGSRTFKRPVYAGNAILTVEAPEGYPVVATVRVASYSAVESGGSAASLWTLVPTCPSTRDLSRSRRAAPTALTCKRPHRLSPAGGRWQAPRASTSSTPWRTNFPPPSARPEPRSTPAPVIPCA